MKEWGAGPDHILYEPRALAKPSPELFDLAYWKAEGRVEGSAPGRGAVVFVKGGKNGESWALRHYKRGGQVGKLVEDTYLWLGLEAARPWREMRLTSELHARGLPDDCDELTALRTERFELMRLMILPALSVRD